MKRLVALFAFIGVFLIVITVMQVLPDPKDNGPGAGDIWWMNVPEINEMYEKVSEYTKE
mgnify:CR=1 FL=1